MITFARYENAEETSIAADIDGKGWTNIKPGSHLWSEITEWTEEEGNDIAPFLAVVMPTEIDAERDRRVAAGFTFAGKLYQGRRTARTSPALRWPRWRPWERVPSRTICAGMAATRISSGSRTTTA